MRPCRGRTTRRRARSSRARSRRSACGWTAVEDGRVDAAARRGARSRASRVAPSRPRSPGCGPGPRDAVRSRARARTPTGSRGARPCRYRNPPVTSGALDPTPLRADVAVVGAGAAGLYAALVGLARGRARGAGRRARRSRSRPPTGRRAGSPRRSTRTTRPSCTSRTRSRPAAGWAGCRAIGVLCAESPGRVRDLAALGVHFDADRHGALALGLEGGHSRRRVAHAGGSATGRRITRELSALVATDPRIEVLENTSASALWMPRRPLRRHAGRDARARRGAAHAGADRRPGDDPRHRRRRRAVGAHDQPARGDRRGHVARPPRGRRAGRPGVRAVPPHRDAPRRRARRLPDHRGDPRRGREAARPRRRAVHRRARPARPGRAGGRGRAPRARRGAARHARDRHDPLPERAAQAAPGGRRPGARPRPRRAGRALHDGRHPRRPRRPRRPCPACTPSASARATACTGRTGWRRTRWPSASSSAAARRWPRSDEPALPAPDAIGPPPAPGPSPVPPPATRAALWRLAGHRAHARRDSRSCATTRFRSRRWSRPAPSPARRAAARTSASTIRRPTRGST